MHGAKPRRVEYAGETAGRTTRAAARASRRVGASGAVGGAVVEGLVGRGVDVRAASRSPERLRFPSQVSVVTADMRDPESFRAPLDGVERLFLYADVDEPEELVATIAAAGVRHVVLLSSSAVTFPGAESDFNGARFLRVERAVAGAGLEYTFLRPGGFASNAARWSWGVQRDGVVPLPHPDAVQVPVHEQDIADVAVAALTGDALLGRTPVLSGPERLTLRQQVAIIADVVGRPVRVLEQTEAEASAMLSEHLPAVWVEQIIADWRVAVGTTPAVSDAYRAITGRSPRTFRQWVVDHAGLFTAADTR